MKPHSITSLEADSKRLHGSGNNFTNPFSKSGEVDWGGLSALPQQLAHAVLVSIMAGTTILRLILHGERRGFFVRRLFPLQATPRRSFGFFGHCAGAILHVAQCSIDQDMTFPPLVLLTSFGSRRFRTETAMRPPPAGVLHCLTSPE
jgi:hypothetical protein